MIQMSLETFCFWRCNRMSHDLKSKTLGLFKWAAWWQISYWLQHRGVSVIGSSCSLFIDSGLYCAIKYFSIISDGNAEYCGCDCTRYLGRTYYLTSPILKLFSMILFGFLKIILYSYQSLLSKIEVRIVRFLNAHVVPPFSVGMKYKRLKEVLKWFEMTVNQKLKRVYRETSIHRILIIPCWRDA